MGRQVGLIPRGPCRPQRLPPVGVVDRRRRVRRGRGVAYGVGPEGIRPPRVIDVAVRLVGAIVLPVGEHGLCRHIADAGRCRGVGRLVVGVIAQTLHLIGKHCTLRGEQVQAGAVGSIANRLRLVRRAALGDRLGDPIGLRGRRDRVIRRPGVIDAGMHDGQRPRVCRRAQVHVGARLERGLVPRHHRGLVRGGPEPLQQRVRVDPQLVGERRIGGGDGKRASFHIDRFAAGGQTPRESSRALISILGVERLRLRICHDGIGVSVEQLT